MKFYTKLGIGLTAIWVLILSVIVVINSGSTSAMTLNEWGDYLAGVSAPLALLWLVIGYFQHGEELRLNTEALKAQQEELRRQVEETAILAKNSEKQTRIMKEDLDQRASREARDARPELVARGGSSSGLKLKTTIENRGGEARDIKIHYEGPHELKFSPTDILDSAMRAELVILQKQYESLQYPIRFRIDCTDRLSNAHIMQFELREGHKLNEIPNV